jgi:hypothetical protein
MMPDPWIYDFPYLVAAGMGAAYHKESHCNTNLFWLREVRRREATIDSSAPFQGREIVL